MRNVISLLRRPWVILRLRVPGGKFSFALCPNLLQGSLRLRKTRLVPLDLYPWACQSTESEDAEYGYGS